MTAPIQPQPEPLSAVLKFSCIHCRTSLEVPAALAGITGPCPACGGKISAPLRLPAPAQVPATSAPQPAPAPPPAVNAAALLSKPPPVRDLPPPVAPLVDGISRPDAVEAAPMETRTQPRPVHALQPLFPQRERGIFDDPAAGQQLDMHLRAPSLRRRGWQRWMDLGIVSVFTGLVLATLAALRFTVPVEDNAVPGLPPNLTELVQREQLNQEVRRIEAGALAQASLSRYLGAPSENTAASHLLPPPEGISAPPFPPFAGALPDNYTVKSSRRIAGTDRFLVVMKPKEEPGPVFVVEQTDSGPRLHSGPITQQSAGLYQKFFATPGEGEATLYTEVKPTHSDDERAFRTRFPDLSRFQLIDVRSAFPGQDLSASIACIAPGSEAARVFARRSHDPAWRPALAHFRWSRAPVGGPYVEVTEFIPATWSGDRILTSDAATAALRP